MVRLSSRHRTSIVESQAQESTIKGQVGNGLRAEKIKPAKRLWKSQPKIL